MINTEPVALDPEQMKIARQLSWLCNIFQEHNFTCEQKQMVLRKLIKKFKQHMRTEEKKHG